MPENFRGDFFWLTLYLYSAARKLVHFTVPRRVEGWVDLVIYGNRFTCPRTGFSPNFCHRYILGQRWTDLVLRSKIKVIFAVEASSAWPYIPSSEAFKLHSRLQIGGGHLSAGEEGECPMTRGGGEQREMGRTTYCVRHSSRQGCTSYYVAFIFVCFMAKSAFWGYFRP